ncbi:unnamed protein product [Polarella glacialis]|uniref:Uncharacterized protein n=1 Tax=Polarella glacialis TaxID=89957 RepID=A0A813GXM8_POLGL|nr:unnamed protein product [Polarella glacialis]
MYGVELERASTSDAYEQSADLLRKTPSLDAKQVKEIIMAAHLGQGVRPEDPKVCSAFFRSCPEWRVRGAEQMRAGSYPMRAALMDRMAASAGLPRGLPAASEASETSGVATILPVLGPVPASCGPCLAVYVADLLLLEWNSLELATASAGRAKDSGGIGVYLDRCRHILDVQPSHLGAFASLGSASPMKARGRPSCAVYAQRWNSASDAVVAEASQPGERPSSSAQAPAAHSEFEEGTEERPPQQ